MSLDHESRRLTQMTQDIKHFIVRSMSDPQENRRFAESFQRERLATSTDTFSTIAGTFGFKHHEGTDHNMELRVIKVIMIREGILMSLKYAADLAERQGNLQGNNLLELMSQLRESTLNYLEYLCLWRQSAQSENGEMQPRAFMWENQNYTMKLIGDLDFLGENAAVVEGLNLSQEQLRSNPLMLSNNLEDFNTWMPPEERAAADVNGNTGSAEFQTRLRLRYAERILLQEMELYNFEGSQIFMTQDGEAEAKQLQPQQQQDQMMIMGQANPQSQAIMVGSNVLENEYDYDPYMQADDNPEFAGNAIHAVYCMLLRHGEHFISSLFPSVQTAMMRQNQAQDPQALPGSYFSPERRVKTTEGSNRTSNFSQPQSRASTISNGFVSAPSTSHGGRAISRGSAGFPPLSSGGGGGMMPMEYGHDFFTGHWGDGASSDAFPYFSEPSFPTDQPSQPSGQQNTSSGIGLDDDEDGEEEVLYTENNNQAQSFESYTPMNDAFPFRQQPSSGGYEDGDDQSLDQNSVRSIESVSEVDMRVLSGLFVPPKVVNLAGAVAVILMSKGNEIPMDASWPAFLRLMKRPGFMENMNSLNISRVARFKLLAVQPMLDQIFYDERANHEEYSRKQMSFQELIAVTKLMNWVRQFSETEMKNERLDGGDKASKKKAKKKKPYLSPFKVPPGALAPLNDATTTTTTIGSKHTNSQASGGSLHSNSLRKRSVSPLQLTSGQQNVKAKEKLKASRVKEKTVLVHLARKQMEDKEKKEKEATLKKTNKGDVSDRSSSKGKKQAIPKVHLDIVPFHQETLDNIYIHPVLVVLLTSPDALDVAPPPSDNNSAADEDGDDTYSDDYQDDDDFDRGTTGNTDRGSRRSRRNRPEGQQKNEEDGGNSISSIRSVKYVVPAIPKTSVEHTRLVIKVYDSTDSKEAMTYINMREYQLFLQDLPLKLTAPEEEVNMFFQPFDLRWWAEHIAQMIVVNVSGGAGNKLLKVSVSKQKIEEYVRMQIVNLHRLPVGPGGRRQTFSTPRRASVTPGSAGTDRRASVGPGSATGARRSSVTPNAPSTANVPVPSVSAKEKVPPVLLQSTAAATAAPASASEPTATKTAIAATSPVPTSTKEEASSTAVKPVEAEPVSEKVTSMKAAPVEATVDEVEDEYHDDFAPSAISPSVPTTAAATSAPAVTSSPSVHAEESLGYGDDFDEASKPATATASQVIAAAPPAPVAEKEASVDYLEESFEADHRATFVPEAAPATVEGNEESSLAPEEEVPQAPSSTQQQVDDNESIAESLPIVVATSQSAAPSVRNSVEFTAAAPMGATPVATSSVAEQPPADLVTASESLYGSDFEHNEGSSTLLAPASPLRAASIHEGVVEDAPEEGSLIFEVSANTVNVPIPMEPTAAQEVTVPSTAVAPVSGDEDEDDDGIYDDDLSEAVQAPIDRSMSMSASMRMSASFNHGSSNPPSSSKPPAPAPVLEPEDDDHSLYNIPDDDD